ncbi:anthranilate synthase component I family protein [Algoriphagus machipongonensis]|uniref:Para-aminobenzoate synthase, component I n=1 Tax=Algoriphagus machipongonensis TaxID=388413 RepID=A3I091_9BACT|nr:anthranilate synthase component I family protein [Algoriphagus machipongonensis]EAZ79887.1 para-aminobenzoate synthase, component I [Algoriphagus machipongonensis]
MEKFPFSYKPDFPDWQQKLLYWADQTQPFLAYFQGNQYPYPENPFEHLLFTGNQELKEAEIWDDSLKIQKVGIIGYDFKNRLEKLESNNPTLIPLPDLCFFQPQISLCIHEEEVHSKTNLSLSFWQQVEAISLPKVNTSCQINPLLSKEEYIESVLKIQDFIKEGETYELNFCQAFTGDFVNWDPISAFHKLQKLSPMPFSALFKAKTQWLISASPERFLTKKGRKLIGQPIKGTIHRGSNQKEDLANKSDLLASEKERAENLMITDLTRNDLSKVSLTGSVKVDELFGIYPFPRVFQMISTVSSILKPGVGFEEIIQATFPMGSMTGAPKIRTMKLIEELENFKRNWFSGAIGWIDEQGDFDFSVVIRSIIADLEIKKLYFGVGSAITSDANAALEYEECLLKAQVLLEVLDGKSKN